VAALLMLAPLAACGSEEDGPGVVSGVTVHDEDGMHGAVLTAPYQLPDATLTDSRGQEFPLAENLDSPLTLVFFGYTHCPDICQAVMADVASAVSRLDAERADDVSMWFVTTDPARDDPETLRSYLDRFDPDFEGLTGPLPKIVAVAAEVKVGIEEGEKLPSGGYEINHGTPILGVRQDGSVPILWTEGTSAAKLAEDIDTILTSGIPGTGEES
jgi:protein SCO1